jgi:prophage regulatory protein
MRSTLLRLREVQERLDISRTEIYRKMRAGAFPQAIRLGPNRIAFLESEIEVWVSERARSSTEPNATPGGTFASGNSLGQPDQPPSRRSRGGQP